MPTGHRSRRSSATLAVGAVVTAVAVAGAGYTWAQSGHPEVVVVCESSKKLVVADERTLQCPSQQRRVELVTTSYSGFLDRRAKAADADTLDGRDSSEFGRVNEVFHVTNEEVRLDAGVVYTTVASVPLPAGTYLLLATTAAHGSSGGDYDPTADCLLRESETTGSFLDAAGATLGVSDRSAKFTLQAVVSHDRTREYELVCRSQNADTNLGKPKLTALSVG